MEDYKDYLQTERWRTISRTLKSMAGYRCQRCGAKKQEHELNVHHLTYAHKGEEERHTEDLIVLCEDCHWKEHHPKIYEEPKYIEGPIFKQNITVKPGPLIFPKVTISINEKALQSLKVCKQ
jgi:5-methylcytosine-specific restriction endonuclease McrA